MTNQVHVTDLMQLTLTLKMITAQVVETSVTVNNSAIQDYTQLDDHVPPTYEMTPGFNLSQRLKYLATL